MKTIILTFALAATFCSSAFSTPCDHSTLTIKNNSQSDIIIDHVNETIQPAIRTRGIVVNLESKTRIAPGKSHTATFENNFFSGYGNWGTFDLVRSNGTLAARVNYNFQTHSHSEKICHANVAIEAFSKPVYGKVANGSPARINLNVR